MKWKPKKLTKKSKAVVRQDLLVSVAMVSIMLNIFFFSGVLLFASTNRLDTEVYNAAWDNLCNENYYDNLADAMDASDNMAKTQALFEVTCQSGEFQRYYDNAVESYLNDTL